jgi:hypothetical protein
MIRHLRGILVFGGFTVNTLFWFIPLFVLALIKLILPIATHGYRPELGKSQYATVGYRRLNRLAGQWN